MKARPCHCCGGTGKENDAVLIGAKMKAMRQAAGIQQKFVALKLNISAAFLSDLEHGRRYWTQTMIDKYKEVVGE